MTTTPEPYTPGEESMKFAFVEAATEPSPYWDALDEDEAQARWDRFIARVKADAAAEALRGASGSMNDDLDYGYLIERAEQYEMEAGR